MDQRGVSGQASGAISEKYIACRTLLRSERGSEIDTNLYFSISHPWNYPIRVALAGPLFRASGPAWDPGELVPAYATNYRLKYYAEPAGTGWGGDWTLSYRPDGSTEWSESDTNTGVDLAKGAWEMSWTWVDGEWSVGMGLLG